MRLSRLAGLILLLRAVPAPASAISEVRYKVSAGDLASAEAIVEDYQRANGENSEYAAAVSWLARGALVLGQPEVAARYLAQTKSLIDTLLKTKKPEDDSFLETAIGASIEVEARVLAERGQKDQAVAFLKNELPRWRDWWIQARIYRSLDLLTLEGQSAPDLDASTRGRVVLLFLWAHWCGDCKAQAPVIARLKRKYGPRGLLVMAPTRRYGEVPDVKNPTPEQEASEIERVWKASYAGLEGTPHLVSEAMMLHYGVCATPTLVLIDRRGVVRMYRPTRMTERQLGQRIEALLGETP